MSDKLLSVEEVSRRLDVTQDTVRRYIRTKQLNAIRLGSKYKVSEEDLAAFINERRTKKEEDH